MHLHPSLARALSEETRAEHLRRAARNPAAADLSVSTRRAGRPSPASLFVRRRRQGRQARQARQRGPAGCLEESG